MKAWDHPEAQYSKRGHTSFSVAVWTPEHNGDRGLEMARQNQKTWGGHVFMSTSQPGYVIWFDRNWCLGEIMTHELTRGHSGLINPTEDQEVRHVEGTH